MSQLYDDEATRLAFLVSQHLASALGFGLIDDQEPISYLPLALPGTSNNELPVWQRAVELAQLSEVQLRKCEVAREFSRAQHEILAASNKSLLEALALLCDLPLEQETEEAILNFIESWRKNQLDHRQIITEFGTVFLFKILSPIQAAVFYGYIQRNLQYPIAHSFDWMLHIHNFLSDENESRWMDTYSNTPPRGVEDTFRVFPRSAL